MSFRTGARSKLPLCRQLKLLLRRRIQRLSRESVRRKTKRRCLFTRSHRNQLTTTKMRSVHELPHYVFLQKQWALNFAWCTYDLIWYFRQAGQKSNNFTTASRSPVNEVTRIWCFIWLWFDYEIWCVISISCIDLTILERKRMRPEGTERHEFERREPPKKGNTVYVTGHNINKELLKRVFSKIGVVINVTMEKDKSKWVFTASAPLLQWMIGWCLFMWPSSVHYQFIISLLLKAQSYE